jgi:hypothetical protein
MFVSQLETVAERLRDIVSRADPNAVSASEAVKVTELFCICKRACEAGIAIFGDRVKESGGYAESGHRSAEEWLGQVAGESSGRAKGRLDAAQKMKKLPGLDEAVRRGDVSNDQAQVIGDAAVLDPESLPQLLDSSANDSFAELKEKAASVKQAALSEEEHEERQKRIHRERHIRSWIEPTGGVRGSFFMTETAWGRILAALDPMTERIFKSAREIGERESRDAYRVDALVALLSRRGAGDGGAGDNAGGGGDGGGDDRGDGGGSKGRGPGAMVHLRVNVESLLRGMVKGDEVCEIKGVGPVPVSVARSLLPDCVFDVLVRKGKEVVTITGKGHYIPDRLRSAVHERDRHCRWPNCTSTVGLQIHHWKLDVSLGGKTVISDLAAFCIVHHDKFTYGGWRVELTEDGVLKVIPPEDRVSLALLERRRRQMKLDAAKRRLEADRRPTGKTDPASKPEQRSPSRT